MKLKHQLLTIVLLISIVGSGFAQRVITVKSLLNDLTDRNEAAKWPVPYYTIMQASSYDRASVSPNEPGWFANEDHSNYIRTDTVNGHREQVMMDVDGPGAIVRFWLTTFKRAGIIRIYFDRHTTPEVTIPAYDLMKSGLQIAAPLLAPHSSYEPTEKGGSTLYLPLPYARHCKVTFEDNEPTKQPRYYQINYRNYPKGTLVKTFTVKQLDDCKALVTSVNDKLANPVDEVTLPKTSLKGSLEPTKQLSVNLPSGSSAIHLLQLSIKTEKPEDHEQALRSTILQVSFDGEQTIWCPVGDFGGSGVGARPLQSWYRTITQKGKIISRWVMPYQKSAKITLLNLGAVGVKVSLTATTGKWNWDKRSMYFHADWRSQNNVPIKQTEKDKPSEWEFNVINGKGVFMGDSFAVYNHMHKWYGEGDQKLWVDNLKFPTEYGTGTEDYYNTSWAPVVLYQTPFANAPRADNADSFGHNTFTRTRNLDAVPFAQTFKYTLETLGWENGTADFAATTYWYGFKNTKSKMVANQVKPDMLPE
ncbi:glycoside hydrolase family 172 protein [Mucilaginibacter sp. CAU 1740]|uniref:glycoside hydrolase family 172 protein n=1 Tax=Mucilaginibacter sp. CAU 1740 TaxID=3140365 RepID=UPI00325B7B44